MKKETKTIMEDFKKIYSIKDEYIVERLLSIKLKLANERNINMSNEELLSFLNKAMNYDKMQIWLYMQNLEGLKLTINDKLRQLFKLKTDEDIIILYDIMQNYNEKNIENIRTLIKENT